MYSKILIDSDDQGLSTIQIILPNPDYRITDVRDKLVKRFVESGMFCLITRSGDNNEAEIHSMNAIDVLANIRYIYGTLCKDQDTAKEFDQAVNKLASLLEDMTGERSTAFYEKVKAQDVVYGSDDCMGKRDILNVAAIEGTHYQVKPKK